MNTIKTIETNKYKKTPLTPKISTAEKRGLPQKRKQLKQAGAELRQAQGKLRLVWL